VVGQSSPKRRSDMLFSDVDIYVRKRVLFDHSDDDVVRILRNCLPAMSLNGRLHGIQNCAIPLTTNSIYGNEP
jgi:O-methyltransferase domain